MPNYEGNHTCTVYMNTPEPNDPCVCPECYWRGPFSALGRIGECWLTPNDAYPAGVCPECGSLAYVKVGTQEAPDAP